ncbi:acetate--CoA ligase family protein [Chloroflexota bacterium]
MKLSPHPIEELIHPQSIAVVGASGNSSTWGYSYTHHLLDYGFKGAIYPVNPRYQEILGVKSYPSLRDVPGPVDYVISCVPAAEVLDMIEDCHRKGVKTIHLYTARFSETGRPEAARLEQEILNRARAKGIRLIGPNCMGLYYPQERIAFAYDLPKEPGKAGFISQTGGGVATFINTASMRGIRFSKVISYGNAIDLTESDYLDYFAQDPETEIILMYVEGLRDGKRFINSLRHAASAKPVIITKGGRGKSGARAAVSHTASLAGSIRTWEAAVTQAGAIPAQDFDEMTDLATSFYFLPRIPGPRVGISGGGGGAGVLAADECEEAGLDVIPLPEEIREELRNKGIPVWDWIGNPADVSILGGFGLTGIDMLQVMANNKKFDLLIVSITEVPFSQREETLSRFKSDIDGYSEIKKLSSKPLLIVLGEKSLGIKEYHHWRWKLTGEIRTKFLAAGIPFYPTTARAARAARKLIDYYQRQS